MKTKILPLTVLILLLFACQSDDLYDTTNTLLEENFTKSVLVDVPFKADFSVWDESDYTDDRCGGSPNFFLTMNGSGNITHLGITDVTFTFCFDASTGVYTDTNATFVAANGDELYAEVPIGYIIPNEEDNSDYYQTKFNDPMYFVGGTGRFEDASGEAMTHAYVHDGTDEWRTDFFSEGTLIMKRGN